MFGKSIISQRKKRIRYAYMFKMIVKCFEKEGRTPHWRNP